MFTLADFVQPSTLEEAYTLLVKRKSNRILGGCAWLRLSPKRIGTGIDLSNLNLNEVQETDEYIEIGAMTTLRELETNSLLNTYFNGIVSNSVKDIIGVQFRNVATIGASVYSKFGFSDVITALLALETEVELYKSGRIPLRDFLNKPLQKDILVRLYIKKENRKASYQSLRNSVSDFPILTAAVSHFDKKWTLVVGARPQRAQIAEKASVILSQEKITEEDIKLAAKQAAEELSFGANSRGSAAYRQEMCKTFLEKGIREVLKCK